MVRRDILIACATLVALGLAADPGASGAAASTAAAGRSASDVAASPPVTASRSVAAASAPAAAAASAPVAASHASARAGKPGAPPQASAAPTAPRDTGFAMRAGQDGTVFRSLTVEGEDRVHIEFERPALTLGLDPARAPGLDWGSARDVLDRTVPDLTAPMLGQSAHEPSPYLARPWLARFASGPVARFRPEVKGVERWKLTIVDARGQAVASYEGRGEPPREIAWDGRGPGGSPVVPGLTYSYVLEARDRAGNRRNFVGQGFQVSAYRLGTLEDPVMVFSGRELPAADPTRALAAPGGRDAAAPILLEAASWLNQSPKSGQPVRVTATARTLEQAQALCTTIVRQVAPHLLGDPARLQAVPEVQSDAPEAGAVRIAIGR